jgi:hypothetical protein
MSRQDSRRQGSLMMTPVLTEEHMQARLQEAAMEFVKQPPPDEVIVGTGPPIPTTGAISPLRRLQVQYANRTTFGFPPAFPRYVHTVCALGIAANAVSTAAFIYSAAAFRQ